MNAMLRTPSAARSTGQSVYEVLLVIACVAMGLALILAVWEYVAFYQGPTKPYKFEPSATVPPVANPAAPAPTPKRMPAPAVAPGPAGRAAPTAPMAAPGTTAAPATTSG
jgi:hypothetical protein